MASVDSLSIQITASTTSAKKKVDELVVSLNALVSAINQLDTSKFDSLSTSVNTLSQGLSGFKGTGVKQIQKVAQALHEVSTEKGAFKPIIQDAEQVNEKSKEITANTEQVSEGFRNIDTSAMDEMAAAMDKVSAKTEITASKMSGFKALLANLKIIVPTDSLDSVNKKVEALTAKVQDLKDKIAYKSSIDPDYINDAEIEKDQKKLQGLINELDRLKLKKQELESHGGFKFNNFGEGLAAVSKKLSSVNSKLSSFASRLHKAKSASRDTSKATKDFSLTASKLAKELLRVSKMLKLMVTRMALRAVIKEVGTGFKSLALHSDEFNRSMSNLINASQKLGYSFSAMVAPLINALAPALVYVINLLTRLINVIQQIFGALTGKGTWNKAKDFTNNWAQDIQDANKEAKELKKTVLGFDELNQMQEKYKSGGSDNTSGNIVDMFETVPIEQKWKDVADYLKNLAKRLFDPIKKAWEKVGDFVKKSWKYALDELLKLGQSFARDFWKVWEQEETQKIFENILRIIGNIGLAVGNLAKRFREAWDNNDTGLKILEAIRDIILIITNHLVNMSESLAEWTDTLNFEPLLVSIKNWLESLEPVVDNLMGVVEDFWNTVFLPFAKYIIEEFGPNLFQVFTDFNEKVDWEGLRAKLQTLWEHLEPFMETVGQGLIIFINDVAQALADFINSKEFEDFLKAVEDWMDSVTPQDVADGLKAICAAILAYKAITTVLPIFKAITSFLGTLANIGSKVAAGIKFIVDSLKGLLLIFTDPSFSTLTSLLYNPAAVFSISSIVDMCRGTWLDPDEWEGLLKQLTDYIFMAWNNLWTFISAPLAGVSSALKGEGFGKGFAEEFQESWQSLEKYNDAVSLLRENHLSIKGSYDEIIRRAEEFKKSLEENTTALGITAGAAKAAGGNLNGLQADLDKVQEGTLKLKDASTDTSNNVKDSTSKIKTGYDDVKESIKGAADQAPVLTEKQKELGESLKTNAESAKTLKDNNKALADGMKLLADNLNNSTVKAKDAKYGFDNLKASTENVTSLEPKFTQAQKNMADALDNTAKETDNLKTTSETDWNAIDVAVTNTQTSFSGNVKTMEKDMQDGAKEITKQTDDIKKAFDKDKWTLDGVAEGLKKTFERAKDAIKDIWNSIAEKLNGDFEIGSTTLHIKLPTFAYGGFPEDGLFLANHGEMVGQFSNGKTAVANNAQIVEGISAGVYNAVTAAMSRSNSGNGGYIANTIVVDGEVIARTVTKAQQKQNMRYSPVMG